MRSQRDFTFFKHFNHREGFPRVREFNLNVYALENLYSLRSYQGLQSLLAGRGAAW